MNNTCCSGRQAALLRLQMADFALIEANLYLDTHPCDEAAIDHFNHYQALYKKAMKEYADAYGPLSLATASPDKVWDWGMTKNPWERGAN